MKNAIHIITMLCGVVTVTACVDGGERVRDSLRRRIDWAGSEISLQPAGVESLRNVSRPAFVPGNLEAALDGRAMHVDRDRGTFEIRDERGYDESAKVDLARIKANTASILAAAGVAAAESEKQTIRGLGAAEQAATPGAPIVQRRIATKVFVDRRVAGLPVAGDRLVLTFTNDGEFRKMVGRWREIDYGRSKLTSKLTRAELETAMVEHLERMGVEADSDRPIRLGTRYAVETLPDGARILVLQGYAVVLLNGPDGADKPAIYELAI